MHNEDPHESRVYICIPEQGNVLQIRIGSSFIYIDLTLILSDGFLLIMVTLALESIPATLGGHWGNSH